MHRRVPVIRLSRTCKHQSGVCPTIDSTTPGAAPNFPAPAPARCCNSMYPKTISLSGAARDYIGFQPKSNRLAKGNPRSSLTSKVHNPIVRLASCFPTKRNSKPHSLFLEKPTTSIAKRQIHSFFERLTERTGARLPISTVERAGIRHRIQDAIQTKQSAAPGASPEIKSPNFRWHPPTSHEEFITK